MTAPRSLLAHDLANLGRVASGLAPRPAPCKHGYRIPERCEACENECPRCDGTGSVAASRYDDGHGGLDGDDEDCPRCGGLGVLQ